MQKYLSPQQFNDKFVGKQPFKLWFNELEHKYTDSHGRTYTSMTTIIGKYEQDFESKKITIARACSRKMTSQYYGWSVDKILKYWEKGKNDACEKGTKTHNKLENITKVSTNFYDSKGGTSKRRELYTILDIQENHNYGELDLDKFLGTNIKEEFFRIYNLFLKLSEQGYRFYSEIGVFSYELLVSGLIDIVAINFTTKRFIIVDWKTNKDTLIPFGKDVYKDKSGYFTKDINGVTTDTFIETNEFFLQPLDQFQQSKFNIYTFQLSGYAALMSSFGFILDSMYLFQIREELIYTDEEEETVKKFPHLLGCKRTDLFVVPNRIDYMIKTFHHHYNTIDKQQLYLNLQ